ncbi:DNA polymerase I A, chloroplastic/mitochondrial [Trifolium repens]|nr:DNA polymerase I A, chloroplastic/mitochondrial [Trifolium repens]
MWVSSQSTTPFRSPYYCSSCLSFSNSSSKPFRFPLSSLSFFASYGSPQHRRKMKSIHIANNVLLHSSLSVILFNLKKVHTAKSEYLLG